MALRPFWPLQIPHPIALLIPIHRRRRTRLAPIQRLLGMLRMRIVFLLLLMLMLILRIVVLPTPSSSPFMVTLSPMHRLLRTIAIRVLPVSLLLPILLTRPCPLPCCACARPTRIPHPARRIPLIVPVRILAPIPFLILFQLVHARPRVPGVIVPLRILRRQPRWRHPAGRVDRVGVVSLGLEDRHGECFRVFRVDRVVELVVGYLGAAVSLRDAAGVSM